MRQCRAECSEMPAIPHWLVLVTIGVFLACGATTVRAQEDFFDMSLDELLSIDLELTSVSMRSESVFSTPAAAFVIASDDIRRAGVTSIPEALRLAPGIEVAQIDGNKWAISSRGFNLRFANKLLVLIDGRAVYSPLFTNVFWDAQDTILEDIARIEVIRGPGATIWGANAVNGVVNIITKNAQDTQGVFVRAGGGNQESGFFSGRWGGKLGDSAAFRVYAKHLRRDENTLVGVGGSADDWYQTRIGYRIDASPTSGDTLMLQGEVFDGDSGEAAIELDLEAPIETLVARDQPLIGGHLLFQWDRRISETDDLRVRGFYDQVDRDWALAHIERATSDIYVDYRTTKFHRQHILMGAGYRLYEDKIAPGSATRITADPPNREEEVFNAFLQDEIELVPDRWNITLGSKFEYNDFTGLEFQPNLRLMWTPSQDVTWWTSVSRAVRTPGRLDRDSEFLFEVEESPIAPLSQALIAFGNPDADSETLDAYEAGFRVRPNPSLTIDVAAFYNEYARLRGAAAVDGLRCLPSHAPLPGCLVQGGTSAIGVLATQTNRSTAESRGVEIATDWRPFDNVRVRANYTYFNGEERAEGDEIEFETLQASPEHQASLRVGYRPTSKWDLDLWLRYVDSINSLDEDTPISGYTNLDLRAAWKLTKRVEVAFVGKNVLRECQTQYLAEFIDVPLTAIQRSFFVEFRAHF